MDKYETLAYLANRGAIENNIRDPSYEFGTNPCSEIILRPYQTYTPLKEITNMQKLYTWKKDDKEFYGNYLATNSDGKFVMEEKGTGEIHVVDKKDVEEVIPHTVDVKFVGNGKTKYSYFAEKGKWNKGDLLVINAASGVALVTVQAVDTKSTSATKDLDVIGRIIVDTV